MKSGIVHIGVDVSKGKLDVFVPAQKEGMRPTTKGVDNCVAGFREIRDIARKARATVCVEPTGGYELLSLLNRIARDPEFTPSPEPEYTKRNATAGRKRKAA